MMIGTCPLRARNLGIILLFAMQFVGCSTAYFPNTATIPTFRRSGELQASAHFGLDGLEGRAACSLTPHIGVAASGAWIDSEKDSLKHHYIEAAGILSTPGRPPVGLAASAGVGYGRTINAGGFFQNVRIEGDYLRSYIQGAFLVNVGADSSGKSYTAGELGLAMRFAGVHFTRFLRNDVSQEIPTSVFWEPSVWYRGYFNSFFGELQGGLSLPVTDDPKFDWQVLSLSVGVGLVIM
jgi:hypothetical protein